MMQFLRELDRKLSWKRIQAGRGIGLLQALMDQQTVHAGMARQQAHPNPLNRCGQKCFSQADEDGITLEILRRLGLQDEGVFAEFGVGDGMENNTLVLRALGWRGFWVSGAAIRPRLDPANPDFRFLQRWITLENIHALTLEGLSAIGANSLDVVSLDLDGNDLYFLAELLQRGIRPRLYIAEYNAKFPPPVRFSIAYDPQHRWREDDWMGVSLYSLVDLFAAHGYRLVCCNAWTGANAFFVDEQYADRFADVPQDVVVLYTAPLYWTPARYGHRQSTRTVEHVLSGRSRPSLPAPQAASR